MNEIESMSCARCGQLPVAILPGPGHCTCRFQRRRVAHALAAIGAGRPATIFHRDLFTVVPELAVRIVSHSQPTRTTDRSLSYGARS